MDLSSSDYFGMPVLCVAAGVVRFAKHNVTPHPLGQ
jgi:hypothetical protein